MRPLSAPPRHKGLGSGAARREPPLTREPSHRHDPAPSIWSYRLQRIMLTPYLRVLLRVGAPSLVLALISAIYLADEGRRGEVFGFFTDLRDKFQQRPEFMVTLASIEGASPELAEAVRGRMGLQLPQSSFDLDLQALREKIEALDAVKSADLRVRSGGTLQVIIVEREPVAVWRAENGLTLVDETGHRVAGLFSRADRADLPLIAGAGADRATPEALRILSASGPLIPRIRGLLRQSERRWDIILDRDQRILLPAENPVRALERLLALDKAQDILARDLAVVDLRISQRPTLRMTSRAMADLRRAQGLEPVETDL